MKLPTQRYSQDLRRYYRLPAVQVSLTLVLSVFVVAIFIVFALRPTILSIATLKKTISESQKTLKTLDTKVANLEKAAIELESFRSALPQLNMSIPNTGADYSSITKAMEGLAQQSQLSIESETLGPALLYSSILSPYAPSRNQEVVELPFTIRVAGPYPNISVFLDKLVKMERIIGLDTITVTSEVGTKQTGPGVALNITGKAFYLADPAQIQKAVGVKEGTK